MRIAQQVGLSLDEIRNALASLPDERTPTRHDWERLSSSWQPLLDARIELLERLRDRLSGCIGCGCLSLDVCPLYNPGDELAERGPGAHRLLEDQ
jgi:MerR family redox-sensitive transcriptional activator SoxR